MPWLGAKSRLIDLQAADATEPLQSGNPDRFPVCSSIRIIALLCGLSVTQRNRTWVCRKRRFAAFLNVPGLEHLTFLTTDADTTIVPKGIDKGSGLLWAKKYLKLRR